MVQRILSALLVTAVLGCFCSQEKEPATAANAGAVRQNEETDPRWQAIIAILVTDMTDEARMVALERYADVGMSKEEIDKALGGRCWSVFGHGPGFSIADYGEIGKPGLVVYYYPDGEAYAVGYRKDAHSTVLRSDDPVTWPKTKNERYEQLRRKKGGPNNPLQM